MVEKSYFHADQIILRSYQNRCQTLPNPTVELLFTVGDLGGLRHLWGQFGNSKEKLVEVGPTASSTGRLRWRQRTG